MIDINNFNTKLIFKCLMCISHTIKEMVKIVQYNILSELLANQKFYVKATPEEVDPNIRWCKIKDKIQEHMTYRSIICLQEIGKKWAGKFHVLCHDNKYHMINDHYGADFSDYMGNAICVPDEYIITDVVITKVGDLVPKDVFSPPSASTSLNSTTSNNSTTSHTAVAANSTTSPFKNVGEITTAILAVKPTVKPTVYSVYLNMLLGYFGYNLVPVSSLPSIKDKEVSKEPVKEVSKESNTVKVKETVTKTSEPSDLWKVAATRYNTCISVKLEQVSLSNTVLLTSDSSSNDDEPVITENDLKKVLWVHTYHMPCAFTTPQLMTIHSCLFLQHVQKLSGSQPYVICVDFNAVPDSAQYQLYTEGVIDSNVHANAVPPPLPSKTNFTCQVRPVKSAYKTIHETEPKTTCSTYTKYPSADCATSFQGCLDYIFYDNCTVTNVEPVETLDSDTFLPSLLHPSDHLELVANFDI
jgi:mRNA deadenylase 3'-5' endonuclease subunit Ccr4